MIGIELYTGFKANITVILTLPVSKNPIACKAKQKQTIKTENLIVHVKTKCLFNG